MLCPLKITAASVGAFALASTSSAQPTAPQEPATVQAATRAPSTSKPTREAAIAMLGTWKATPKKTGMAILEKYGPPDEMTRTRMVWINTGPWVWSILTNDPTPHQFPVAHEDVLEQAISYAIPEDRVDELAHYDGSIVANRTQGELSARCDKEEANFLAVNLANDVAKGAKTVDASRQYYAAAIDKFMKHGQLDPYMKALQFEPQARAEAADPDRQAPK